MRENMWHLTSIVYVCHTIIMHLSIDGYSGWVHFLTIVNVEEVSMDV